MEELSFSVREDRISSWVLPKNSDRLYTSDQLIDAYFYGKRNALEATKRLVDEKFSNNIDKSGFISSNLLIHLQNKKYTPVDAYLRINAIDNFDIMVTVPENEMMGDDFLDMYNVVSEIETRSKDEYYDVLISFCPLNDNFEEKNVFSDGFLLKLAKDGK